DGDRQQSFTPAQRSSARAPLVVDRFARTPVAVYARFYAAVNYRPAEHVVLHVAVLAAYAIVPFFICAVLFR
ncbi:MAG: hypothetical protein CBARDMAM_4466, partial [uncultured Caballeronia sp.]